MPVTGNYQPNSSNGNGVTTVFAYNFRILREADLLVTIDGVEQTSGYTVTGVGSPTGGSVTFSVAPASGTTVMRARAVPYDRETDYQANGDLLEETLDADIDRLAMQIQQLAEWLERVPALALGSGLAGTIALPAPGAGEFLRWNASGTNLETADAVYDNGDFLQSGSGAVARTVDSKLAEVVSIMDFGGIKDGTGDNKAAADAASAAVSAKGGGTVFFPSGTYNFTTVPAEIPTGVSWVPEGHLITTLKQDCAMSAGQGFIKLGGVDHYIGDFIIEAAAGRTNGHAIQAIASSSNGKGSFSLIGDVYITGTGTWERGISVDGSAKTTGAQGVRTLQMRGGQIFQCTEISMYLKGVKNFGWNSGSGLISTPSTPSGGNLVITGDATVTSDNTQIKVNSLGTISIDRCINADIEAPFCGDITIGSNAQNSAVRCNTASTVVNSGSATFVYRNGDVLGPATLGDHNLYAAGGSTYGLKVAGATGAVTATSNDAVHTIQTANGAQGDQILAVLDAAANTSLAVYQNANSGANAAAASVKVGTNSSTGRSINAGGTVNASGADYAEYETKRADCGTIAAGDIVGIDADGLLTDDWRSAIAFAIKSTNPAYVGGDAWASDLGQPPAKPVREVTKGRGGRVIAEESAESYDAKIAAWQAEQADFSVRLEAKRVTVDRIAYAGKVPVNVTGASPGQWIVPVRNGNRIGGAAKDWSAMSEAEREITVGRVRRVLPDKRAEVTVR